MTAALSQAVSRTPAYARQLIQRRAAGYAPWRVHLFVGADVWHFAFNDDFEPALIVVPDRHDVCRLDLTAASGAALEIYAMDAEDWTADLAYLCASAAHHCAPVRVYAPRMHMVDEDVSNLAFASRVSDAEGFRWPEWWSEAAEADYRNRAAKWWHAWEGARCP